MACLKLRVKVIPNTGCMSPDEQLVRPPWQRRSLARDYWPVMTEVDQPDIGSSESSQGNLKPISVAPLAHSFALSNVYGWPPSSRADRS